MSGLFANTYILNPVKESSPNPTEFGLEAVWGGKALTWNFWIYGDLVGFGELSGIKGLPYGCKILQG